MSKPIDIDCVDGTGTDEAMVLNRALFPDALRVHSVGHMVRSILAVLSQRRLRRLRIFAHGDPGRQGLGRSAQIGQIGVDYLALQLRDDGTLAHRELLGQLRGKFLPGGWAELHGCSVAGEDGQRLLRELAKAWQVNVAAGIGVQHSAAGWEGNYLVAHAYTEVVDIKRGHNPARPEREGPPVVR